ncbi:hypothetical protein [Longispora urticae]
MFMIDVERRYLLLSEMEAWAVWAVMTEAVHSIGDPPAWAVDTATGATSTLVTTMGGERRNPDGGSTTTLDIRGPGYPTWETRPGTVRPPVPG